MAFWMGSELYVAGGSHVAVKLTPGKGGVFKVTLNGEVVWDKAEQGRSSKGLDAPPAPESPVPEPPASLDASRRCAGGCARRPPPGPAVLPSAPGPVPPSE